MNILSEILKYKEQEVKERKDLYPVKLLEKSNYFNSPVVSLKKYLMRTELSGIIAEIKRKSPSKGMFNEFIDIKELSLGYMRAGAAALSILTDNKFFGGSSEDLKLARKVNLCPILRKDFIIDEYQIVEARSIGADVILLIAAALDAEKSKQLARFAKSLGLEVLLEVHSEAELKSHLSEDLDHVGVNNRDLTTFTVDLELSKKLAKEIPSQFMKISESGISDAQVIKDLKDSGFNGFLIGETFMKEPDPAKACAGLVRELGGMIAELEK